MLNCDKLAIFHSSTGNHQNIFQWFNILSQCFFLHYFLYLFEFDLFYVVSGEVHPTTLNRRLY